MGQVTHSSPVPQSDNQQSLTLVWTSPGNFRRICPMAYCLLISSHTQQVQNQTSNFHPNLLQLRFPSQQMAALSFQMLRPETCRHPCLLSYHKLIPSANPASSPFQYAQHPPISYHCCPGLHSFGAECEETPHALLHTSVLFLSRQTPGRRHLF